MFAILIGVVATLIIVAVVIVVILRSRGHTGEDKRIPKNNGFIKPAPTASPEQDNSSVPLKKSLDDLLDGADDKNPDVVPHSLGKINDQRDRRQMWKEFPLRDCVMSSSFTGRDHGDARTHIERSERCRNSLRNCFHLKAKRFNSSSGQECV